MGLIPPPLLNNIKKKTADLGAEGTRYNMLRNLKSESATDMLDTLCTFQQTQGVEMWSTFICVAVMLQGC